MKYFNEILDSQSGIFRFTNWWILAIGALLVASAGFATVISLHVVKGPTPILVMFLFNFFNENSFILKYMSAKINRSKIIKLVK